MNATSYGVGSTGGNREDLRGPLTILEPEETPFTSMVKKGPAPKSTLVEHGADRMRAPKLDGTREGFSGNKGGNKTAKRQRFGSYLHRWHESFGVSDVQQLITENGGNAFTGDEYGFAKTKTIREMKRDMEARNLSSADGQGGSDDEMKSRGFFKWLASSQTPAVPSDFQAPAAQTLSSVSALVETGSNSLNSVLKSLKGVRGGAREYNGFVGSDYQENIDNFTRVGPETGCRYRVQEGTSDHEINLMVKVFRSSFGSMNVIPNEFLNVTSAGVTNAKALALADMSLWEMLFLDELHSVDDDEDAGGLSGYCKAIGGLFCLEPRGNAYIVNTLN